MNQNIHLPKQCLFCRQIIPDDQSPGYVGVVPGCDTPYGRINDYEYAICQACKAESDAAPPPYVSCHPGGIVGEMEEVMEEFLAEDGDESSYH
jgi:hypothetical protein